MYQLKSKKLRLTLEIVPVASLLEHEQILLDKANRLIFEFQNLASLQNPIIVDENHVVLDGNHRTYVFKQLGFRYIPVCKIDYFDETTKLRCWFRLLGNIVNLDMIQASFESAGCRIFPVDDKNALQKAIDTNPDVCGLQCLQQFFVVAFPASVSHQAVTTYDLLHQIQQKLTAANVSLEYVPCNSVHKNDFCQMLTSKDVVLWTPRLSKETVVSSAKENKIFAPKTTRHVLPARPLNVNIPGLWLKENVSSEEINQRFEQHLRAKQVKRFAPGQIIDGRYYQEELYFFYNTPGKG